MIEIKKDTIVITKKISERLTDSKSYLIHSERVSKSI